ncbi:PH domain-containing protein [Halomicroarcula limicola]|uniref:PH domain-containing protein n=1 Tax=Haloarcula limicola TaxID=1429915 RepID=A0A8J8C2S9_9EURY|nr:PH domain-containing protein [Halomicroarcula limicola]MBV0923472.1 PH domain-containing protein [Halomicroarcula limicola]
MPSEHDWLTLDDDEEIVWRGQPSTESLYGTYIVGVPMILLLGLGLVVIASARLRQRNTDYVITDKGVYKKTGIFSRAVTEIDLDKVQNTSFSVGAVGRYFDYGDVMISTAGGSGVEMTLRGVADPQAVQKQLSRGVKRAQSESDDETDDESKSDVLVEILTELQAIRQSLDAGNRPGNGDRRPERDG